MDAPVETHVAFVSVADAFVRSVADAFVPNREESADEAFLAPLQSAPEAQPCDEPVQEFEQLLKKKIN